MNFYDYQNQAWVQNGRYVRCGHTSGCDCYGTLHAGEPASEQTIEREGPAQRKPFSFGAVLQDVARDMAAGPRLRLGPNDSISYREAMIDAGRGHLLRGDE